MRAIEITSTYKSDYKREKKGVYAGTLDADLNAVLTLLVADSPLPRAYKDHPLTGTGKRKERDLHIHPDLVLIYSKKTKDVLTLIRLGSHSEVF